MGLLSTAIGGIASGVAGGLFGGDDGGGGSNFQRTQVVPWEPQGEQLQFLFDAARQELEDHPFRLPNDTFANIQPGERGGMTLAQRSADQIRTEQLPQARQASDFGLNFVQDIPGNPVVQDAISAALQPIQENFERNVLPSINSGAVEAGQVGSSRQGVAQGLAINDLTQNQLNTSRRMMGDFMSQGMDLFSNTLQQQPQLAQLETAPANIVAGIGDQQRALEQGQINADLQRAQFNENARMRELERFNNILSGSPGGTSSRSGGGGDPLMQGLGAGLSTFASNGGFQQLGDAFSTGGQAPLASVGGVGGATPRI